MTFVRQLLQRKPTQEVWSITPEATVYKALELLAEKNIGAVPVVDNGGDLVGMFSERDYARKVILQDKSSRLLCVGDIMSHPVHCIGPDETIERCMEIMTERHIRHLPVCDGERMIGIISIGDVLIAVIAAQKAQIRDLEHFINGDRV